MKNAVNTCEVAIEEVAWTDGKPLKWQAHGVVINTKGREVTKIYGDPRSTKEGAWRSLWDECNRFDNAASMIHGELIKGKLI